MSRALTFVLLGHPVGHSVSPAIHGAAYRALGAPHRYEVRDCPTPEHVRAQVGALRAGELAGANVTVPWKRLALELADRADDSARATGVANVLSRDERGVITASNTDAGALADEIASLHAAPRRAAVIGTGGAAQAAVVACRSLGLVDIAVSGRSWVTSSSRTCLEACGGLRGARGHALRLARARDGPTPRRAVHGSCSAQTSSSRPRAPACGAADPGKR